MKHLDQFTEIRSDDSRTVHSLIGIQFRCTLMRDDWVIKV